MTSSGRFREEQYLAVFADHNLTPADQLDYERPEFRAFIALWPIGVPH
jgi:hypothetical protein